jgi:hypothetical protein
MCASGEFSLDTRIFFPERNAWIRAGDTELGTFFAGANDRSRGSEEPGEADEDRMALESDYNDALQRIEAEPALVDAHVEAGRLAAELDDREAAGRHFQAALDLQPFSTRVAQEIKRRFSKGECKNFRYLERDAPVWENLTDLVAYPLSAGVLYPAIPAAATSVFLFVPYGAYAVGVLFFLWCVQVARRTAAGESHPPLWHPVLADPVRELILPFVAGTLVLVEFLLVFYAIARLVMVVGQESGVSAVDYTRNSPILVVVIATLGIAYLPVVFVRLSHSVGLVVGLLNPWKNVQSAVRMEQEYLASLLVLCALGLVVGTLHLLTGGIPVVGKVVLASALAYALPVAGFVLGRLLGRMRHVL